jgi:threonine dehydratase
MPLPDLADLNDAASIIGKIFAPTPQILWPLLSLRCGTEVWIKHENHTPVGAFKVRGGLVYMDHLKRTRPGVEGVIAATRGNHGQSVALAASRLDLTSTIVVPHGNSREKNAAMRALGAELIEQGHDFQAALEFAHQLAADRGLHFVPSFDPLLVAGVGTLACEFLTHVPTLETVYMPIGLGSSICGMIAARNALGRKTKIVGVVAEGAPAYALSFKAKQVVSTNRADTMADGVSCRVPQADALALILAGVDRVIQVSDAQIQHAMRCLFTDTHNVAEGAGAVALAGLISEGLKGQILGAVLTGGNIDQDIYAKVLATTEETMV